MYLLRRIFLKVVEQEKIPAKISQKRLREIMGSVFFRIEYFSAF